MATLQFEIRGMSCGHCVRAVEEALKATADVHVESVEIGKAVVTADANLAPALLHVIEDAGYSASLVA